MYSTIRREGIEQEGVLFMDMVSCANGIYSVIRFAIQTTSPLSSVNSAHNGPSPGMPPASLAVLSKVSIATLALC